jgi:hypothetical protein
MPRPTILTGNGVFIFRNLMRRLPRQCDARDRDILGLSKNEMNSIDWLTDEDIERRCRQSTRTRPFFLLNSENFALFSRRILQPRLMGKRPKTRPATRTSKRLAEQPTSTQSTLPPELWTTIFAFLSAPELCAAKLICRHWRDIASSMPIRATCIFCDFDSSISDHRTVENESIRVDIGRNNYSPFSLGFFLVPGLTPFMHISVEPVLGDWDAISSDYPLFDTIRELVSDRCGLNVTLVMKPSYLKSSRFPARYGIQVYTDSNNVERIMAAEHDVISPVTREYLLTITTLQISRLTNQTQFKPALALMPNINYMIVDETDNIDFGLEALPNLRNLKIDDMTIDRNMLGDIAKLRHLERLQLLGTDWDEVDWDAVCDMLKALSHLWYFSVDHKSMPIINALQSSEKLRRAMDNITHFVVRDVSDPVNAIEILSRLENIKYITVLVYPYYDDRARYFADISAAKAKAHELQSARLSIQII